MSGKFAQSDLPLPSSYSGLTASEDAPTATLTSTYPEGTMTTR